MIIEIFRNIDINFNNHFRSSNPSSVESFCFGVLARSFAGTTLLPVTVIKTRYEVIWISKSDCICMCNDMHGYHATLHFFLFLRQFLIYVNDLMYKIYYGYLQIYLISKIYCLHIFYFVLGKRSLGDNI